MSNNQDNCEYIDCPVPLDKRRSLLRLFPMWIGFIIVVGIMSIGGGMAGAMPLKDVIYAILLGNILLGGFAALSGYVGADSGMTFSQLLSKKFVGTSGKIVSLYAPLALIGWYAIESAIFGSLVAEAFNLSGVYPRLAMAGSAVVFSITCYFGFRAIHYASIVLIPLIVGLSIYSLFGLSSSGGEAVELQREAISFDGGLSLVVGSWILGVVACLPDIARFAKSPFQGALLGFVGIFVFNSLTILVGVAGATLTGQYDPAGILLASGVPILAAGMAIANIWTTNDNNLYSASLGLARVTPLSRRCCVVVCALIGVVIALFNPAKFDVFFKFLGILGTTAPALGGVVIGGYLFDMKNGRSTTTVLPAWIGWAGGAFMSIYFSGLVAPFVGFLGGIFLFVGARRVLQGQPTAD